MLAFSRHNIFAKLKNSEEYFLLNLLSKEADILTSEEAKQIKAKQIIPHLLEKGYAVETEAEYQLYQKKYQEFLRIYDSHNFHQLF